ncbi:ComK protein [Clostridium aceticum]|uniref:ComK protein n=1 Tax=Clostridium aceticum TaxID=84022 RepID=A0A0D8I621_9CLOT|nr:competence protein ComK [Clostridium aceticum]AKL93691.1 ComK protein [Clostridium aceticum]KJF25745.1 hypothetical protein TZ02_16155 [Clostridium aceticum]
MKAIEEILKNKEKIAALLPIYKEDLGNVTTVILQNGEEILLRRSIESILHAICSYYTLHLRLLRKKQQKLLNCKYYLPLPLSKDLLLFPIKTRVPKVKNDSSLSYINFFEVKKLDLSKTTLHLNNGKVIDVLSTASTLKKRYHQASLIKQLQEESAHIRDGDTTLRDLVLLRELLTGFINSLSSSG